MVGIVDVFSGAVSRVDYEVREASVEMETVFVFGGSFVLLYRCILRTSHPYFLPAYFARVVAEGTAQVEVVAHGVRSCFSLFLIAETAPNDALLDNDVYDGDNPRCCVTYCTERDKGEPHAVRKLVSFLLSRRWQMGKVLEWGGLA